MGLPSATSSQSSTEGIIPGQVDPRSPRSARTQALRYRPAKIVPLETYSDDESDLFEEISGHSSKCTSPKSRPGLLKSSNTKENIPPINRPGKKSIYSSAPSSPAKPAELSKLQFVSASAPSSPFAPTPGTPQWKSEQLIRREPGTWKVKGEFKMPQITPEGHTEVFDIEEARKQLKKTRSVLRTSKDRKNQELLSIRALNLPVDTSVSEEKLDECLVKLFDGVSGFKTKPVQHKGHTVSAFSGSTLAKWLCANMYFEPDQAVQFAQTALMNRGVFVPLSSKHQSFHPKKDLYYQFKFTDPASPLNACKFHTEEVADPVGLSKNIVHLVIKMLGENRTLDGGISFGAGRNTKNYLRLSVLTTKLQTVNLQAMTPQERSAFYINTYNALAIHSRFAVGDECKERVDRKHLSYKLYLISQSTWGSEDIKSSLRGVFSKGPGGSHPILACLLFDGSSRSAPIRAYDAADFSEACLPAAVGEYLQKNVQIDSTQDVVFLPRVFKDLVGDFASSKALLETMGTLMESKYLSDSAETLEIVYHDATFDRVRYFV